MIGAWVHRWSKHGFCIHCDPLVKQDGYSCKKQLKYVRPYMVTPRNDLTHICTRFNRRSVALDLFHGLFLSVVEHHIKTGT